MAKSYFKLHARVSHPTTGRYITAHEEHVFFDDEDFVQTRMAYNHVCARVSKDERVSVFRTPIVFGPWRTVPVIRGEFAPCR